MHSSRVLLVLLTCTASIAAADESAKDNGGRPDLLPVRARWHTFPADVKGVRVDPKGRTWFEIEGSGTIPLADLKRQVEQACSLPAPWVKGAKIILFDHKGRIWIRPWTDHTLLLGYDPIAKKWTERRVVPEKDRGGFDEKNRYSGLVIFMDSAHESKSGRLYFSDRLGVHVLDGDRWDYQLLYKINLERKLFYDSIQAFDEPRFAEDDAGRVFVWTGWGRYGWTGTVGYFTHDARSWTHRFVPDADAKAPGRTKDTPDSPDPNRIASIIPLARDRVAICTESGPVMIVSLHEQKLDDAGRKQIEKDIALLGDKVFRIREAAYERLVKIGAAALPLFRDGLKEYKDVEIVGRLNRLIALHDGELRGTEIDGHQFRYCRVRGYDAKGNAWLWYDRCKKADGPEERGGFKLISREGRVQNAPEGARNWYPDGMFADRKGRMYFARYRSGCVAFDGDRLIKVTNATQSSLRYILGEDADGRIYLTDERRVFAFHADVPDDRPVLLSTIYDVPWSEHDVAQDSLGRTWAFLGVKGTQPGSPAMSVFEKGAWREVALPDVNITPENLHFFMPLKKGCFVVRDGTRRALFFDGNVWHVHASLKELVQQRHKQLASLIDNRQWGRDFFAKLRVDADGRIWLVEWDEAAIWDGKSWLNLYGPLKVGRNPGKINFLMPLPGGKDMLAGVDITGAAFKLSIDKGEVKATPFPLPGNTRMESDYATRSGLWIDGQDRLWIPKNHEACVRIGKDGPRVMANTGFPRFADSKGCIWFHNPVQRKLVVLDPKGNRGELSDDSLGQDAIGIGEDTPGNFWVSNERGLLHVQAKTSDKEVPLRRVELYDRDMPHGQCLHMSIDREHSLWFYGPGADRSYRLYRVQLPGKE